ncbi:MAG: 50S ribosomal protein L21 [Deltaproteobacteria bacterium]|nr:MAG: 50S ribosomal protein L21 [Deltaproteobacteria bacterium]
MYAVVRTGGKQYVVSEGDFFKVEKLAGEVGEKIVLDDVLLVSDGGDLKVGAPAVDGAKISGTIVEQGRGKKIIVFKMKRRKGFRKKQGHRQAYTGIKVDSIEA